MKVLLTLLLLFLFNAPLQAQTTKSTFLFYISADAFKMVSEYYFYDHLLQVFDLKKNKYAAGYNAVILFDPYDTEKNPTLDVFIKGVKQTNQATLPKPIDMGSPKTLAWFLKQIKNLNLNSEQYYLVFDGHGSAWEGFGFDEHSSKIYSTDDVPTVLKINEISGTIQENLPLPNKKAKFDAIIFNSCLMGSLELIYQLRNQTDYLFATSLPTSFSGSDVNTRKKDRERALSYAKYQYYFDYALKFNFLDQTQTVEQTLNALLESRVMLELTAFESGKNIGSDTFVTYAGDEYFKHAYLQPEVEDGDLKYVYQFAPQNYFYAKTSEIVNLVNSLKAIIPKLKEYVLAEKQDLFYPSQLTGSLGISRNALVEVRKLLHFLSQNQAASRFLDQKNLTELNSILAKSYHTAYSNHFGSHEGDPIASYSVFLPSYSSLKSARSFSALNGNKFDEMQKAQGILDFNKASGWDAFLETYINANSELTQKSLNQPERGFLSRGLR